ncbi:MAG: hypothetical protein J6Y02_14435 [Pseudobutyrivibrio sp.]|nr:hypothetical protein [Pseudobutyrivibrio sp.]
MLDFLMISCSSPKKDVLEVYPTFIIKSTSEDLMIRGGDFYAVWDEESGFWSTNENDVIRQVDNELNKWVEEHKDYVDTYSHVKIRYMWNSDSGIIDKWHKYVQRQMRDCYHQLDDKIIFSNTETKKSDWASKKLPYPLQEGPIDAYEELISTLYSPKERKKIEWAIGSIISGDSKRIQKFIVFFGSAGSGKSTILKVIEELFTGYWEPFDAKSLGQAGNDFALEAFKSNPLIAIQHDGDLSRIEDNTKLNSIVSHEKMEVNMKYQKKYSTSFNSFLFMGTNRPVKITEAKSGILRRLIDVRPSGNLVPYSRYMELRNLIKFELSGIASHCLKVYQDLGENYYEKYIPRDMMSATNDFYDFVENYYDEFKAANSTTLKEAWTLYESYRQYANIQYPYPMRVVRTELKNYFRDFREQVIIDGKHYRNYYSGFLKEKFFMEYESEDIQEEEPKTWLYFKEQDSIFDKECVQCPAQYASERETPMMKWSEVKTTLIDINTSLLHYVKVPENHIVIDFDLKDSDGNKSYKLNAEAASKWPETYAELSKSGSGIHLHYIYDGDVTQLSRIYDEDIEVKVFSGNSSLRRKLTKCNDIPIRTINTGLPLKGAGKVVNFDAIKNEKALRTLIKNNLDKKYHDSTKPSVDFIYRVLEDAYSSGMNYDVTDLRSKVLSFANDSTNQSEYCVNLVSKMHFCSDKPSNNEEAVKDILVFFDVEVFPNLFVVVWKKEGDGPCVKMINPSPLEVEELLSYKLVGFNCRRYDNHILYARVLNYSNEELFKLSQKIIEGSKNCMFGEAYNLSYADVYDFSSKKQSLKKWEIELDIHHQELGLRWDEPVEERLWPMVADYCVNDVIATEAVFKSRKQDFIAREVLADLSGLTVNDTTQAHTAKIIFGDDPRPQTKFVYTDLGEIFSGYKFDAGHSEYRGEDPGEGGYVYSNPGMYGNVALLDIASMHPNSLINLNYFGPYTDNFKQLLDARIAIKHKDFDSAKKMLGGVLSKYLEDESQASDLAYALKIVINSVYGLTSAKFDNKFKDPRNIDNIVAKRGALFMIDLKHAVQERGYIVAHIKTDSIKIPDADPGIINFIFEFGKKYGYTFEHEATYDKLCLVNDAVYIAREKKEDGSLGKWTATGTQFQVPYVFKTLFSKEKIEFSDLCETKTVTTALYLDMNESLPEGEHDYHFVGKAGRFCPILPGKGGGLLLREKEGKFSFATGSKGYRWLDSEMVKELGKEKDIDRSYYNNLVDEAVKSISEFGDFEWFTSEEKYIPEDADFPF